VAVFLATTNNLFGQIPVIETPKPATLFTMPSYNNNPTPQRRQVSPFPNAPNPHNPNPLEMYERDKRELQRRNAEIMYGYENSMSNSSIQYDLPSQFGMRGTEYYQEALDKLSKMLRGESPLNLKDAVFTVENAYFENQLNYSDFNKAIKYLAEIARSKTMQDGYNWKNPITKNVMLFRTMADTMEIKIPQKETSVVSYPMQYDFEDYSGKEDWTKLFVSKLLATHKGQCHSLPLLYLILCEETGTEANLAYSPSHSYIKFKDNSGNWYNLELTNRHIVSDAYIVGSGYITAEAIKNKLYMEPQTKQQVIAQCISDLAMGYAHKYGYDSFIKQCVDSVLKYDPNNLGSWMMKSNYETQRFEYVVNQVGRPPLDTLKEHYPKILELLEDRNTTYRRMDASGYREMPKEAYEAWLKSVNEEKEHQEYDEKYNKVLQLIK
ncbi:MAG: hypothetical protein FWD60_13550, partial [Candidatus Azobacteroides sp.]|nr:hypothetical protein [Candidatus Azobacteroides sp.]